MKVAAENFRGYIENYVANGNNLLVSEETFIDDVLYGLGVTLSPEYRYGQGFDKFKARLRKHLEDK